MGFPVPGRVHDRIHPPPPRWLRAPLILVGLGAVALALAWSEAHPARPMVGVGERTFRCATAPPGSYGRHPWVIENLGAVPLRIRTRFTSGRTGFSLWQGQEHAIEPGDRIIVHLTWVTPRREGAPFTSFATLRTNDPTRPEFRLAVVGRSGLDPR